LKLARGGGALAPASQPAQNHDTSSLVWPENLRPICSHLGPLPATSLEINCLRSRP